MLEILNFKGIEYLNLKWNLIYRKNIKVNREETF